MSTQPHGHPSTPVIDLDAAHDPGSVPGLGLGDLLRWAPIVTQIIAGVKQAIAGGSFTIPLIKVNVFGHHVSLGPIPISVVP
jgi:hypothetical protein